LSRLELVVALAILLMGALPALTTWAQDSGATSFTIASANGNVVIKRADGSAEMAQAGTVLRDGDQLASVGRSEARVNLGAQASGSGATLLLFSDTTIGVRGNGAGGAAGGGGFYVADLAQGVVLARTVSGSNATVQITNESAGAVAQLNRGGMAVSTDVGTGTIAVACDDRTSQVAFPYTDMRVPCENNVVRTLSNQRSIEDSAADSTSPISSVVGAAGTNVAAQQQQDNERQAGQQTGPHAAGQQQDKDNAPAVAASPVANPVGPIGGAITITLSWTADVDYDAHLSGPTPSGSSRFHVYFGDKNPVPYASLDEDIIGTPLAPEIITITPNPSTGQFVAGEYRYWVHDFSGSGFSSASPVTATIRQGSHTLGSLAVGQTTALNIWYLFNLQVDASGNVQVSTLNQFQSGSAGTILCARVSNDACGASIKKD
jgi:hypothetical protein